jgi:apolipoprotein D and lipocalin family protein
MTAVLILILLLTSVSACAVDLKTVDYVDIPRFMGDWYVIAIIPNLVEKNAYNSIESYQLNEDGSIATTYTFRKGSPDGKKKVMRPKGKIYDTQTNAEWRMRVFWPFWAKYLIIDLAEDYRYTVIGVPNRKWLWIMSRTPQMSDEDYATVLAGLKAQDYDISKIKKIPQIW